MTKHKRPLLPTYRIERELIAEHNYKLKRAAALNPRQPICPDCYQTTDKCTHVH
jgi:hypothetical protein